MKSVSPWSEAAHTKISPSAGAPSASTAALQVVELLPEDAPSRQASLLRLTDECQSAIKEAAKQNRRVQGAMTISIENGTKTPTTFTCTQQRLPGAVDAICQEPSGTFRTVAAITNKLVVNATERTFADTRVKMQKLAEEEHKKSAQKIDFVGGKSIASKRPMPVIKSVPIIPPSKPGTIKPFSSKMSAPSGSAMVRKAPEPPAAVKKPTPPMPAPKRTNTTPPMPPQKLKPKKEYPIYRRCHERITRVANEFTELKQRIDRAQAGSAEYSQLLRRIHENYDRYKADHNYAENRRRHLELHSKLMVLKQRILSWEQSFQITPPSSSTTSTPASNTAQEMIYA
ncbi:RNA polymerase II elongation factor ELL [Aphelenchoides fujianensis]|nr:RNA polymerase II elongation factor ELL [Aphelenchoides fujianensis]